MTAISRRVLTLAVLLLAVLAAGCSGKEEAQSQHVVNIASIVGAKDGKQVFNGGIPRIQEDGWLTSELAKKGWTVNWVPVPTAVGGPVFNEGLAAKTIDIANYGDLPAIIAMAGGVDLRFILGGGAGMNIYVVVGAQSTAQSLSDLKGKRVALNRGRPWEAGFARYAQSEGLALDDFQIVNVSTQAGTSALISGKVNAIVLTGASSQVLQDQGLGRILWSTGDSPESWKMMAGSFVRNDFLVAHRDIVQIIVDAFVREDQWESLEGNRDTVLAWGTIIGAPLQAVTEDQKNTKLSWREQASPVIKPYFQEHFDFVADYAAKTGVTRTRVNTSHLIDTSLADQALKDLNLESWWEPATPGSQS